MERALDSYGPPTILQDSYSTLKANEERERCSCQGGIEHNLSSYTHTFMPPTPPLPTYNQSGFRTTIPGPLSEDQEQNGKTRSLCCFQLSPESSMPADCKCVCFYFCSSFRRPLRAWLLCSKSTQPRALWQLAPVSIPDSAFLYWYASSQIHFPSLRGLIVAARRICHPGSLFLPRPIHSVFTVKKKQETWLQSLQTVELVTYPHKEKGINLSLHTTSSWESWRLSLSLESYNKASCSWLSQERQTSHLKDKIKDTSC